VYLIYVLAPEGRAHAREQELARIMEANVCQHRERLRPDSDEPRDDREIIAERGPSDVIAVYGNNDNFQREGREPASEEECDTGTEAEQEKQALEERAEGEDFKNTQSCSVSLLSVVRDP
jgi:hypothetical protein